MCMAGADDISAYIATDDIRGAVCTFLYDKYCKSAQLS